MPITSEQIDIWRQVTTEHQRLEFKEAKQQFDFERLLEYCVALANEGGGFFILGIADKPPREVVGTSAYRDLATTAQKLFERLGFRVDVEEASHAGGRVVVFDVPSRPRGTAYNLAGKYLMRAGEALVPMTEDQLRRIFAEGRPDWLEEHSKKGLTDREVIDLLDTQTFFELLRISYPTTRQGVLDRLRNERLIDVDSDIYAIRRIGAVLLAKELEAFPDLMRKAPRVIVYAGEDKLGTRIDQVETKGYAVGFQRLVQLIMEQLPQNEVVRHALRKEVRLVPERSVRELVANSLVHQDFSVQGASVMVEVYTNRLEISNPGEPIVPIERFIDGYQSRNERLASVLRKLGICEEKSSGIDRVIFDAELHQLPAPDFRASLGRTIVSLRGPLSFDDMSRDDRVRACYQHCALKCVTAQHMTNQSLRERFRLSEAKSASVSQVISTTIGTGLIKLDDKVGSSRKFARYLPFWA